MKTEIVNNNDNNNVSLKNKILNYINNAFIFVKTKIINFLKFISNYFYTLYLEAKKCVLPSRYKVVNEFFNILIIFVVLIIFAICITFIFNFIREDDNIQNKKSTKLKKKLDKKKEKKQEPQIDDNKLKANNQLQQENNDV